MKKILFVALVCISANAGGLWSLIKNGDLPTKQVDEAYQIELAGVNARGYVFTPSKIPNKQCVLVFTSEFFQMECFDKSKDK